MLLRHEGTNYYAFVRYANGKISVLSILTSIEIFVWVINKVEPVLLSSYFYPSTLLRERVSQTYLLRRDRDWIIIALNGKIRLRKLFD